MKFKWIFSNAPFEGRTACWIPYAETGYTKGKKTGEEKDGKVEVERLVDGKVKLFKPDDVEPQNPPKYELLEDMANMTYLSEVSFTIEISIRRTYLWLRLRIYWQKLLGICCPQLEVSLRALRDLHLLWSLLCHRQPLQVAPRLR